MPSIVPDSVPGQQHWRWLIGALFLGALAVLTVEAVLGVSLGGILLPEPRLDANGSLLATLTDKPGPPVAQIADEGCEVEYYGSEYKGNDFIAWYAVRAPGRDRFQEPLLGPVLVNPDGSVVVPREYGPTGYVRSSRPGLVDGAQYAAVFDASTVTSSARLQFGPFFQALPLDANVTAQASNLRKGVEAVVKGERFKVTLTDLGKGLNLVTFTALDPNGTVVASHPGSRVSVAVNGTLLEEVKGSNTFTKTSSLTVGPGESTVVVAGEIPEEATVSISIDSIGQIVRGHWDLPLN